MDQIDPKALWDINLGICIEADYKEYKAKIHLQRLQSGETDPEEQQKYVENAENYLENHDKSLSERIINYLKSIGSNSNVRKTVSEDIDENLKNAKARPISAPSGGLASERDAPSPSETPAVTPETAGDSAEPRSATARR